MDLKQIDANIKRVKTSGDKWNMLVHTTAVAILGHAQQHGDCTRALALVEAMPKSTKRAALVEWFAEYSPIGVNVKERKVRFHKPENKLYRDFNIDAATASPWFERDSVKNEDLPDTTVEQADKMIFAVASKLEKAIKEDKVPANDLADVEARIVVLRSIGKAAVAARKAEKKVA